MGVKTVKHAPSYYVTDGDNELPVRFEPVDGSEVVKYSSDGKRAVIGYLCRDEDPESPRKYDNLGKMVCWHRRYNLGDEQRTDSAENFFRNLISDYTDKNPDEMEIVEVHKLIEKHYVILPLFLYDHSGISMSTGSFIGRAQHAEWDSGQVGWIYVSHERIMKEMARPKKLKKGQINPDLAPIKHVTAKDRERAAECLKGEVETYDQFLTGDVYGVCVDCAVNVSEDPESPEWEVLDEQGIIGYSGGGEDGKPNPMTGNQWEDACWGYFGHKYAKEELADRVGYFIKKMGGVDGGG